MLADSQHDFSNDALSLTQRPSQPSAKPPEFIVN